MVDNGDSLSLDDQICFALYAANRAVTARYRPILEELGLTYPQYLVMLVLWQEQCDNAADISNPEGLRISDLGRRLRLDTGTLTPLLKRLAEREMLTRERSSRDERVVEVRLTKKGAALRARAQGIPGRLLCGLDVQPERLIALRTELQDMLRILEETGGSSG
ncbi:MarR family transcriptional regulator [Marinobacter salinexigens]|uniref:MarR family transcriptional regulator n=1 Tax=Marinobacter salinexigens TaxID=2919747 RepID=A0A5B0VLG0_9GAMM|nr:MarR family transcriptional regulator [Marinobacter salinexigens]KAA1174955.1 MarR family transcriptional regulator [Marinobacter salinexigens]